MEKDPNLSPTFYEQIYQLVTLISKRRVTTYGAIGRHWVQKSSRKVGTALINAHRLHPDNINQTP